MVWLESSVQIVSIGTTYMVYTRMCITYKKRKNIGNNTNSTNKDILYNNIQNKHTKQTYKINIQNKHTKHTYKSNIQNAHTKQTYKTNIQNKHTKHTYKTNIQNNHTKQTYKTNTNEKKYQYKNTHYRTWNKEKTKISGEMHPTQRKNRHTKQYKQQL